MSIVVASVIGLVVIAIIAIPVLISVLGSAERRNPNQSDGEEDQTRQERENG